MDKKKINKNLYILTIIIIIIILLLSLIKCSTNKPKQEEVKEETITEVIEQINTNTQEDNKEVKEETTISVVEEKKEETIDITQMYFWVVFYDQYDNELQREALKYGTVPEYKSWLPEGFDSWDKEIKSIKGNTYYHAICHEVHHSSDTSSNPNSNNTPTNPISSDEESSNTPSDPPQSMPVQGGIIKLNDGKNYKVLNINGTYAKVLGTQDASSAQEYDSDPSGHTGGTSYTVYEDSDLDNFLNITWYGNLPQPMQDAIQSTPMYQNRYTINTSSSFSDFSGNIKCKCQAGFTYPADDISSYDDFILYDTLSVGNRKVWAIDISEIIEYIGTKITSSDLNNLFFNQTTSYNSSLFLSSVFAGYTQGYCFAVDGSNGRFEQYASSYGTPYAVRATFVIDLSYPGVTYTIQ